MEFSRIISDIKQKKFEPIYFLCGEEPYYIDKICDLIEATVLDEHEKEFNQTVVYGLDTDIPSVVAASKRYPMMAPYNVVIVKEAQNLKKWSEFVPYLDSPSSTTVLVFAHKFKKPDGRTPFGKAIKKKAVYFDSKKLYDNQYPQWIEQNINSRGYRIEPKATLLLFEYLGSDLSKLDNEIEKLLINVKKETTIDVEMITSSIGISKDFNVFELNKALSDRNVLKANKIINYFGQNEKNYPLPQLLPMIYRHFSQILLFHTVKSESQRTQSSVLGISPYFLKDYQAASKNYNVKKIAKIMGYLREADQHSKGIGDSSTSNWDILKELVFKIIH